MKRYFTMSLTFFTFSALNAITFLLLGIILQNTAFAEIFSITYPLQFVVSILLSFFASASNVRANKEGNKDCVESGMFLGLVFAIIIFSLVAIFVDNYICFMNMSAQIYRTFTLMSIGQLFFTFINNLITEKIYFQNKDKLANFCSVGFIVLNLLSVVITTLITKNQLTICLTNLICLFVYVCVWFGLTFKKFKFNFNPLKNFKYESLSVISSFFMLIVYLFGYSTAFSFGTEYVVALNLVNLITDPQWDALDAISKIAKIEISNSNYNYKKALKCSAAITLFYVATSVILFFSLFKIYNAVLTIGLIYLAIQVADMLLNILQANIKTFMQLEYSPIISTIIYIIGKVIRTVLAVAIINPFNTNISQIVADFVIVACFLFPRFKCFKLDKDGFLIKKVKAKPTDNNESENLGTIGKTTK